VKEKARWSETARLTQLRQLCLLHIDHAQAIGGVKSVSDYGSILSNHDAASW